MRGINPLTSPVGAAKNKVKKPAAEAPGKNPIMCLNELQPKITFECGEIGTNPDHSKKFRTTTDVDGETFEGFGASKKLSKESFSEIFFTFIQVVRYQPFFQTNVHFGF